MKNFLLCKNFINYLRRFGDRSLHYQAINNLNRKILNTYYKTGNVKLKNKIIMQI